MSDLTFAAIDGTGWHALEAWWLGSEELQACYTQPTPEHFAYLTGSPDVFARMVHEHGEPVGFVQVDLEPDGTGYVGLVIKPELWDQGYGKRILRALVARPELGRLGRIVANVGADNVRSQRCFAGAGFVQQSDQSDKDGCLAFVYAVPQRPSS
jgi:RimJ/RimL family protein N-acetyltransferase